MKEAGAQMVAHGEIDEALKEKLVVKFSPEIKKMLREQANKFFESSMNET